MKQRQVQTGAMGLREKHKSDRMNRILDVAHRLFFELGFEAVRAEQIAEQAEVSVGTLYNYFGGKNEILLTLAAIENEQLCDIGSQFSPKMSLTTPEVFCELLDIYFGSEHMLLKRELWRAGFAIAFADTSIEEARRLRQSDRKLRQSVVDLTIELHKAGRLRSDLDCQIFGETLFNNANMLFLEFTWSEKSSYEQLREQIFYMTTTIVSLAMTGEA